MLRIAVQLRNIANTAKIANKAKSRRPKEVVKPVDPVKKVPIFNLNERDVKAQVRSASKPSAPAKKTTKINPNWVPLITCKRPELNLYKHQPVDRNAKYKSIPLASAGWQHYKSKNDFFIIHPTRPDFNTTHNHSDERNQPFDTLPLDGTLLANLRNQLNVVRTSDVQRTAIPAIMGGRHTLIAAETGCGKTIAYLVPIIMSILRQREAERSVSIDQEELNSPRVVIVTPGRELAIQIGEVIEKLTQNMDIGWNVVTGGATKRLMMKPEFRKTDILVGSIGATNKLITNRIYRLHRVRQVVLDEADTMFDETFSGSLGHLMKRFGLSQNHLTVHENGGVQLVLASATMPENTYDLLSMFVDPETVHEVVSPNLHKLLPQIEQKFVRMRKSQRPLELLQLVKNDIEKHRPVIVFGNKSKTSDFISIFLRDNGIDSVALNGDMLHKIRVGQFAKFQSGEVNVLATTDVASRGLDTTRACHVINFDFPYHISDYLHRIGRIGRIGSNINGYATNFISSLRELETVRKIEHIARTRGSFQNVNNNFTRRAKPAEEEAPPEKPSETDVTF